MCVCACVREPEAVVARSASTEVMPMQPASPTNNISTTEHPTVGLIFVLISRPI